MGRYSTGAITTGEVLRIELPYLLRNGFIRKGQYIIGGLNWNNGCSIGIESVYNSEEKYLKLSYTIKHESGESEAMDYKIQFTTIPSNLGKGKVLYFVCPISGRKARILYKCYGSKIWMSRGAYKHRIYYASQQCSKLDYHNTRYWALERELERCKARSKKKHYQGKPTKLRARIDILKCEKNYHDYKRWLSIPKSLQKGMNLGFLRTLQN